MKVVSSRLFLTQILLESQPISKKSEENLFSPLSVDTKVLSLFFLPFEKIFYFAKFGSKKNRPNCTSVAE